MSKRLATWNNAQLYTPNHTRLIQQTCGVEPDDAGVFRASDVDAIKAFQAAQKIKADGKCGSATATLVRAISGVHKRSALEFWWDSGPVERVGVLARSGCQRLAIMTNRSSRLYQFSPAWRYRDDAIKRITDAAGSRGIGVTLTAWVRPNRAQIDAVRDYLDHTIKLTRADRVEVELEGNWVEANVWHEDFATLQDAADYLWRALQDLVTTHGVEIEATTFPGHAELDPDRSTLLHKSKSIWPQVYSVAKEGAGPKYDLGGKFSPGFYQAQYLAYMRESFPCVLLNCGLAGYGQQHKALSPVEALARADAEACMMGVAARRYWSARHLVPGGYFAEFIGSGVFSDAC